jgi:NAD(P)-dependent dehydrogenase (short-subunit alcohol dehydrogenase family)
MLDGFELKGRVALVIGGSNGLGREIALGLQGAGATTAIIGRTPERVAETTAALKAIGGQAQGYQVDVADIGQLRKALDRALEDHRRIDVLVNSQGVTILKPAEDFTVEEYDRIMDVNLRSVFFATQFIGSSMLARGAGSIINITSIAAQIGFPLSSVYDASKHAVLGITRTFAAEWAGRGVRVNAVAPGVFLTALNRDLMSAERKQGFLQRTPMRRFGDLPEIVGAAIYLASPASSYVTGSTITVDGGYTAAAL